VGAERDLGPERVVGASPGITGIGRRLPCVGARRPIVVMLSDSSISGSIYHRGIFCTPGGGQLAAPLGEQVNVSTELHQTLDAHAKHASYHRRQGSTARLDAHLPHSVRGDAKKHSGAEDSWSDDRAGRAP
jgi:hypothetical protein